MHRRESGIWVPGAPAGPDHQLIIPHPRELATEEGPVWVTSYHGYPTLAGVAGRTASGEPMEVISYEWNEPIRFAIEREKTEEHHLERFNADYRRGVGRANFDSFVRGPDPPDFVVETDGERRNLDVTHLVLGKRARARAIFDELRKAALGRGVSPFRHLRGHLVYVFSADRGARFIDRIRDVLDAVVDLSPRPAGARLAPRTHSAKMSGSFATGD